MAQDEDRLSGLDATIAALKAHQRRRLPERAQKLAQAIDAWRSGEGEALAVRRLAHKLRGAAEDPGLRAMAEAIETSATSEQPPDEELVQRMLQRARLAAEDAEHRERGPAEKANRRARILVVDDDEAIMRMVSMTLERVGGHEVVSASTSTGALEALDGPAFDIILLDAMMPDMNGLELCAEARDRESQAGAVLVVLSAANQSQLGWPTVGGPDHWWLKPMPGSVLLEQIAKLVNALGDPKTPT